MTNGMNQTEERECLVLDAAERARRYLHSVNERPASPDEDAVSALAHLRGELPEHPTSAFRVLDMLDTYGSPATVANAGCRYFGYVNGGTTPGSLAAHILAAAWDQNAAMRVMSPVGAVLEETALEWIRELLSLPKGVEGGLVSGATMANLTCLAAARRALIAKAGWNVESQGLFGAPPFPVVVSEETHISVRKALSLLGLGRDRIVEVPTDAGASASRPLAND